MTFEPSELLAHARGARLRAIRAIATPPDDASLFALRRLLFTDRDAHVRAAAARTLGMVTVDDPPTQSSGLAVEGWLLDAIDDRAPLVRDIIVRALARCGSAASAPALRRVIAGDDVWWVRRAAIYALGVFSGSPAAGEAELATFTQALGDPFWRVRHAAIRVLSVLGAHDPELRFEIEAPTSPALMFLRGSWGPVAVEAPVRAASASLLPPALLDPDPAVVTARIAGNRDVTPLALVELLCDPHVTLRAAAAKRLAATGDLDALSAALDWLEEPRIPHVGDTVFDLLDGLGEPALAIAERAVARRDRPAATRWAIDWIVASSAETLYDAALARVREDTSASLRCAAVAIATDDDLVAWAADPGVVDAATTELHARRAYAELASLPATSPRTRALQVDGAARRRDADFGVVEAALADPHPGPRAIAARWLVRTNRIELAVVLDDPDPTVREAALSAIRGEHADTSSLFASAVGALVDIDPWVRRAAIRAVVALARTSELAILAICAFDDVDPEVRRIACGLPLDDDRVLARVLACSIDRDQGLRAAAAEALDRLADAADRRVTSLLDTPLAPAARTAAYSWLLRRLDDDALALARAGYDRETEPQTRSLLSGVIAACTATATLAVADDLRPTSVAPVASVVQPSEADVAQRVVASSILPNVVEHRRFGRAGFDVAPLVISGAFDLPVPALEHAVASGVDTFFWEPGYDLLARFLRTRRPLRVITGSYHADASSIRGDVARALRTLGRDTLDVFLLFWTRSSARVDAAAYACLDQLKREGKIRAIGFSTHHRDLAKQAIEERAWDVVMIRHSAAHPGIESELLPVARERGTAIVTFSALTYGRMTSGPNAPSPAECYRYSLAQPGVTACISAPRRMEELVDNLGALVEPSLSAVRIAALREHGIGVRVESQRFNTLLRQPTRDAAAAAREMLASEPTPDAELRAPSPTAARRSRTRLGGRRRR